MKIIKQETHTQHSKCLNHLRAAKSEIVQITCARQKTNKQKNPKKQEKEKNQRT